MLALPVRRRYVLPSLSLVPNDGEESVRVQISAIVARLAAAAHRLLVGQQLAARKVAAPADAAAPAVSSLKPGVGSRQ